MKRKSLILAVVVIGVLLGITLISISFMNRLVPVQPVDFIVEEAFPNLTFNHPVGIYNAGDGSNRLFVLEQSGVI